MKSCLDVALSHRSIRKYKPEPVPEDDIRRILEAARRHPSSWNLQPVTVIVVRDGGAKERLSKILWDQPHIREAPVFMIFAVDFMKVRRAVELAGGEAIEPSYGNLLTGLISASMALAWAAAAAESLGYGVAFIAVYGKPCEVADALGLPRYVLPIAGLLVGKPDEDPELRPRQPLEALAGFEGYGDVSERAKLYLQTSSDFPGLLVKVMGKGGFYDAINKGVGECLKRQGLI